MCFPYIEQEEPNQWILQALSSCRWPPGDCLSWYFSFQGYNLTLYMSFCPLSFCPSVSSFKKHLIHGHDEHSFHFIMICGLSCLSNFQISVFTMMFFSTKKYHWIHLLMVQGESWFFSLPNSNARHCVKLPFRRRSIYWKLPRNWQSVWWLLVWTRLRWLFLYKSTLPCS